METASPGAGGQVWDAKLAAVVIVHGVGSLLTFDSGDFARYGITTVDPSRLLTADAYFAHYGVEVLDQDRDGWKVLGHDQFLAAERLVNRAE